jgi:glucan phosphorylase
MENAQFLPLTPEQVAAVTAGGGFARCEDPNTHVVYELIRHCESTIDDDYVRQKLAEAEDDMKHGRCAEWNLDEVKRELRDRLAAKQSSS